MWTDWLGAGAAKDAFDMRQLFNATCICANGTAPLNGTAGFGSPAAYLASNCSGASELYYRQRNNATNSTDEVLASGQVRPPGRPAWPAWPASPTLPGTITKALS